MTEAEHEKLRERAYRLWEEAGRPEGRDAEFWERARREIEEEGGDRSPGPDPGPRVPKR
jgi:hypothetical protein